MYVFLRLSSCLSLLALLVACSGAAPSASTSVPTQAIVLAPTVAPTIAPTLPPTFAAGSQIGGVDVSGLSPDQASTKVSDALAALDQPLEIVLESERLKLTPEQIKLQVPVDTLLNEAQIQLKAGDPVAVPLDVTYDQEVLRTQLAALSDTVATPGQTRLITETDRYSRTFVFEPGKRLDLDQAIEQIDERLREVDAPREVKLSLSPDGAPEPVSFDELQQVLEQMAERWDGVVGIYLYDLKSGQTVLLNERTVFSGASVLKVPIMLQSYISIPTLTDDERDLMEKMIGKSDNFAANDLLAKVVDGEGTEAALDGVRTMNETMAALGLKHTYQNLPYESGDYLLNVRKMAIPKGPAKEGEPPFTEADPYVRTTPSEIGQLLLWIHQCSMGSGPLLERFGSSLSAERCDEMIGWLEGNEDQTRIVAGVPSGTVVAHKSGWVEDMQADTGIVSTPGGDYVLALYFYQPQNNSYLADEVAAPIIAAFSRLIYSAYNPTIKT